MLMAGAVLAVLGAIGIPTLLRNRDPGFILPAIARNNRHGTARHDSVYRGSHGFARNLAETRDLVAMRFACGFGLRPHQLGQIADLRRSGAGRISGSTCKMRRLQRRHQLLTPVQDMDISGSSESRLLGQAGTEVLLPPAFRYRETRVVVPDHQTIRNARLVAATRGKTADTFRILRTKVLEQLSRYGFSSLAVTSSNSGDGKSLVAANLAVALSLTARHTVLLVDLHLRCPTLHRLFGLDAEPGLTNHLLDGVPLSHCLVNPGFSRLIVLPAGRPIDYSSETLLSNEFSSLALEMKTRYSERLVVYNLPAIIGTDDALAFMRLVDCYMMVIRAGSTQQRDFEHALETLRDSVLLGTVLNDSHCGRLFF